MQRAIAAIVGAFTFGVLGLGAQQPCPSGSLSSYQMDDGCGGPMELPPSTALIASMAPGSDVDLSLTYSDPRDGGPMTVSGELPSGVDSVMVRSIPTSAAIRRSTWGRSTGARTRPATSRGSSVRCRTPIRTA